LGVALLALVYLAGRHEPVQESLGRAEPDTNARVQASAETVPAADSDRTPAERAVAEVRGMSPTFRNSTFLIAIRGAGFYCDDVVAASESAEGAWLASCADKSGYTLGVLAADQFDVRPITHYFDGVGSVPIERDPSLEQKRLR
jgi:hypothetical protein